MTEPLIEVLKNQRKAFVSDEAFYPRPASECYKTWCNMLAKARREPDEKFYILVRYASLPGVLTDFDLTKSERYANALKNVFYDWVGQQLELNHFSFLPVVGKVGEVK